MSSSLASRLRYALLGAAAAALVFVTTTALAGSGVGGVFNLGQMNTVDAQSSLVGNPGGQPELKVVTHGPAAAVRGDAVNGIGINGISDTGTGQQGLSQSGIGMFGTHGADTGIAPGVQGETNSTDPNAAGVVGKNNGGGPGLKAIVTGGAPPLAVNSQVKVANLNVDRLDDLDSSALQKRVGGTCPAGEAIRVVDANGTVSCEPVSPTGGWSLTGNTGTIPGANFLGTRDNNALELKVNGQRALRIEPDGTSPNLIGGVAGNSVGAGLHGVTIAGGGEIGSENIGGDDFATVGGGTGNTASGPESTVAGGLTNTASGIESTVAGGGTNKASGFVSTIAGGDFNTASGSRATVVGGFLNTASGQLSFAAGLRALATLDGAFVWGDASTPDFITSPAANTVSVRAANGIWLGTTSTPSIPAGRFLNTSTGGYLSSGGVWTNASDRALKHDFRPVSKQSVLEKVAAMPISSWSYKAERPSIRHIGPTAQDFYSAFGLGLDNMHIATIDESGVVLAAVQGLYRQYKMLKRENRSLRAELNAQNARLSRLERAVSAVSH